MNDTQIVDEILRKLKDVPILEHPDNHCCRRLLELQLWVALKRKEQFTVLEVHQ